MKIASEPNIKYSQQNFVYYLCVLKTAHFKVLNVLPKIYSTIPLDSFLEKIPDL